MKRIINLTIDVKNKEYDEIRLKQMDTTKLVFNVLDNSNEIELSELTSNIIFTKPNGTIVIQTALIDVENKRVEVDLKEDCVRSYGKATIELELKKDTEVLSSFQINAKIEKTSKGNIESDNTLNYIEYLEEEADKLAEETSKKIDEILQEYHDDSKITARIEELENQIPQRTRK